MTQEFLIMQELFACGALGIDPDFPKEIDMNKVYNLACHQGVWQVVFLTVMKLYENGQIKISDENYQKLKTKFIARFAHETKRRAIINKTFAALTKANINPCLLKGDSLSMLYSVPSSRISGDTDIFIGLNNEKKAVKITKKQGFEILGRPTTSHHVECKHDIAGYLELHVFLYDELFEDVWFDNKIEIVEDFRDITIEDGYVFKTLGINDGLVFNTLHLIKHFLTKGVGIRQLCDILLYIKKNKNEIDQEKFAELFKYLKFDKFFDLCMSIGIKYYHFKESDLFFINNFTDDEADYREILDDMEKGGVFGDDELARKDFYKNYNRERFKVFKQDSYDDYMNKWNKTNFLRVIFPKRSELAIKYSYLNKASILYPFAWMQRVVNFVIKKKSIKNFVIYTENEENEIIRERMKFIKKMDMI